MLRATELPLRAGMHRLVRPDRAAFADDLLTMDLRGRGALQQAPKRFAYGLLTSDAPSKVRSRRVDL